MSAVATATRKMTFEEFINSPEAELNYELVDGRLEPLMTPGMQHGRAQMRLGRFLDEYLGDDFGGFLGDELDFPTIPYFGRRGDIVYVAPGHVTEEDWEKGYPSHPPDLGIEVLSQGAERRDTVEKRREYALTGIARYWVVDPKERTIEMLALSPDGTYATEGRLGIEDELTSPLFPGLRVPLRRIFRPAR